MSIRWRARKTLRWRLSNLKYRAWSLLVGPAASFSMASSWRTGPQFSAKLKAGAITARDYLNVLKYNMTLDWTFFGPAIEMHQGISTAVLATTA